MMPSSSERTVDRDPRYSSSVQSGLAIVQCFTSDTQSLGIADLADRLNLSRATTHRYAVTLVALGVLDQTRTRKYLLAPKAAAPGMAVLGEIALRTHCEPVLQRLREQSRHTVGLGVLDGTRATYVRRLAAHLRGQYEADGGLRAGAHLPLHCSALGKALLASLSDEERRELLAELSLTRRGPKSIVTKKGLREELERVQQEGIAISDEELAPGVLSIAAAVEDKVGGRRLAVDINIPAGAHTVQQLRARFAALVSSAAQELSATPSG
jgi:IclR family transcriptional regulator, pca regulon regulatory protein